MKSIITRLFSSLKSQPENSQRLTTEKTFADFTDAFRQKQCPICWLLNTEEAKFLQHLLYESVNDPHLRKQMEHSPGLCANHVNLMLASEDKLGQAILARSLLQHAVNPKTPAKGKDCFICRYRDERETFLVNDFARYLTLKAFRHLLFSAPPLCLRHFGMSKALLKNKTDQTFLVNWQIAKIGELLEKLKSFIKKNDYRFQQEKITPDEQLAITQAWKILTR